MMPAAADQDDVGSFSTCHHWNSSLRGAGCPGLGTMTVGVHHLAYSFAWVCIARTSKVKQESVAVHMLASLEGKNPPEARQHALMQTLKPELLHNLRSFSKQLNRILLRPDSPEPQAHRHLKTSAFSKRNRRYELDPTETQPSHPQLALRIHRIGRVRGTNRLQNLSKTRRRRHRHSSRRRRRRRRRARRSRGRSPPPLRRQRIRRITRLRARSRRNPHIRIRTMRRRHIRTLLSNRSSYLPAR